MEQQVSSHHNVYFKLNNTKNIICTAGIAVDWINDKIYLTISSKIIEFDPKTRSTTTLATLGDGIPRGIGVYPHKNNT